ncbi:TPA: hypothetical protein N0F65_004031 [Lagenidium giganteum]|uniref:Uncharacterized protein n=1 Tax=Lagenidium giganteum TaxID=4803 RepID=A0AAV2YU05_9STRA|nr:TPA: hypothetical protein N0F65_004031 [Lagenidium giganteum]
MDSIRARHDTSLNKIKAAIEKAVTASNGRLTLRVNSTVPDFDGPTLKPDIQLYDALHKRAVISDLAVAFEDHPSDTTSNFDRIWDTKTTKYAPLKEFLKRQGYSVSLSALIYGSLGSIAPSNYQVYTEHLGLLKRDTRRLEYQLSTDHIKASKRIWAGHAGQARRAEQVRQTEAAPTERPTRRSEGRQAQPQSTNQDRPARGAPRGSQDRPTQPSRRRRRRSKRKGSSNRRDTAAPSRNQ